jgi:hypothetical protein
MSVVALKRAGRKGRRGVAAAHGATTRGAAYAKARAGDLATQGQRLARSVDGQIRHSTGKRSAAWIDGASRLVEDHRWTALALAALAVYALFALLV